VNDFVNPQHRGVNLPDGFKDLMDVLKANGAAGETPIYALHSRRSKPLIERYETNGLQHAEKFVRQLLESRSKVATLTFFLKASPFAFSIVRSTDLVKAMFCFSKDDVRLEQSVRETFTKFGIAPLYDASFLPVKQHAVIGYLMPGNLPGLLEIVGELLRCAYEMPEGDGLNFLYHEQ